MAAVAEGRGAADGDFFRRLMPRGHCTALPNRPSVHYCSAGSRGRRCVAWNTGPRAAFTRLNYIGATAATERDPPNAAPAAKDSVWCSGT